MIGYVDPHVHMVSRTTDDYEKMALCGCVAVTEPAFWAGHDRYSVDAFEDYFLRLTSFEPARAAEYGIAHYTWLCLNPKEGEDRSLAREVLTRIPSYLDHPNVIGIGEIGLNRVTQNEMETFIDHVELALDHHQLILIHTPHLEDKFKGTKHIVAALEKNARIDPRRVLIDHAEEHTMEMILKSGFWAGITLYPKTKTSLDRAADMIEMYGAERVCVNSACDWGPSVPIAVPQLMQVMKKRKHPSSLIEKIVCHNPMDFIGQSGKIEVLDRGIIKEE